LREAHEADLANGLGNLCSRLTTLCAAVGLRGSPITNVPPAPAKFHEHIAAYRIDLALAAVWAQIDRINREIADARPWEAVKRGAHNSAREQLAVWVDELKAVAFWLTPFVPDTATKLRSALEAGHIQRAEPLFPRIQHVQHSA
jgi:methionyl-tRNA synthetase